MAKQSLLVHLHTDKVKVDLGKVWLGTTFDGPEALVDRVLDTSRQIERRIRNGFRDLKCYVMILGGEEEVPIEVSVEVSIKDIAKIKQLLDKPPKAISIKYGGNYHRLLDSAWYAEDGTALENKNVSRLMIEGLISDKGTLTPTGQDVFDQLSRMAFDDEKMGITITPELSRVFSLGGILLLGIYGVVISLLGMVIILEESFDLFFGLYSSLAGLVIAVVTLYSIYKLLFVREPTIIVKNDSVVFKNSKTGVIERTITLLDIERTLFHKSVVILLKNGQKEIIGVKDYVKGKFSIFPNINLQNVLSKRILTFIAENYEHVFVPDFLLTLGVPVDVQDLVNPINPA